MEVTADGFGRLPDARPSRRFGIRGSPPTTNSASSPKRTARSRDSRTPGTTTRDVVFSYLHIDDAASIARLAAEAEFDGHETFWAVATDTSADVSSERLAEVLPDASIESPSRATKPSSASTKPRNDWAGRPSEVGGSCNETESRRRPPGVCRAADDTHQVYHHRYPFSRYGSDRDSVVLAS